MMYNWASIQPQQYCYFFFQTWILYTTITGTYFAQIIPQGLRSSSSLQIYIYIYLSCCLVVEVSFTGYTSILPESHQVRTPCEWEWYRTPLFLHARIPGCHSLSCSPASLHTFSISLPHLQKYETFCPNRDRRCIPDSTKYGPHESFTRHTLQYTGISVTENPISTFASAMYSTFDHWQTWIDSNSTWRSFSSTSEAYSRNWLPCPRMFAIIWTNTISDYHLQKWIFSLSYSKHQTQEEWQQATRKWQKSKKFLNLEHNLLHPSTG